MINVVDGKLFRMLVDDEPLDLRYGEIVSHSRALDLRDGVLRRELEWRAPSGGTSGSARRGSSPSRTGRSPRSRW